MIRHLSISQLKLHQKNPRRWVLEYLENIKLPPGNALVFGNQIHDALEAAVKGEEWDTGSTVNNNVLIDFLEANEEILKKFNWNVETDFKIYIDPQLPPLKGRIDLWTFDNEKGLIVFDHKTATPGYSETTDTLPENWQLCLYTFAVNPIECMTGDRTDTAALIGHNQFFKNRDMELTCFKSINVFLTKGMIRRILSDIRRECFKVLKTVQDYEKGGLPSVPLGTATEKWYGKKDPLWPCINCEESIKECKKRVKKLW